MSEIQNGSIHVRRQSDAHWRVTFEIPPLNIFGPANIPQLEESCRRSKRMTAEREFGRQAAIREKAVRNR